MELRKTSFENVIDKTKYDWLRKISLLNISKLEKKQEKCFGISSPPGTPNSSCTGELSSYCGVEINVCESLGSSTKTPTS